MHERTTWKTRHDGLTHIAMVSGDELSGYMVRSSCGIVTYMAENECGPPEAEITCTGCRPTGASPGNGVDGKPAESTTRPRPTAEPGAKSTSNEPRSLAEILNELGFPWMDPGSRRCDSCSE